MQTRTNRRGHPEHYVTGRHLKLDDLKEAACLVGLKNQYLYNQNIPLFPRPEFHVSHLKHDTDQIGLRGIRWDGGFRNLFTNQKLHLLWWSLSVGPDDITSAEKRLLEETFPGRTEQQAQMQQDFLGKFATSPVFLETSRLGSYRFTFPVEEVLTAYSDQFCSSTQPVMRVFETVLYKQEVMYVVLVHSPANQELFSEYPLLSDDPDAVCVYRDGRFIWRSQAMCETHRYELIHREENQMKARLGSHRQFYVWDHIAVALHIDREQVLKFDTLRLRGNLMFCDEGKPTVVPRDSFDSITQAEKLVKELWPEYPSSLMKPTPGSETVIVGDFVLKNVKIRNIQTFCFPNDEISDIKQKVLEILAAHPSVKKLILHVGANDINKRQSIVLKKDFTDLLSSLSTLDTEVFISGPLPETRRGTERFSRLLQLNTGLSTSCPRFGVTFIDNFNLFWKRGHLFRPDGLSLNEAGVQTFKSNLLYYLCHPSHPSAIRHK